jgi:hypothetical protein
MTPRPLSTCEYNDDDDDDDDDDTFRVKIGLRYAYFDNYTAILLDKYIRLTDPLAELGGEVSILLQHSSMDRAPTYVFL